MGLSAKLVRNTTCKSACRCCQQGEDPSPNIVKFSENFVDSSTLCVSPVSELLPNGRLSFSCQSVADPHTFYHRGSSGASASGHKPSAAHIWSRPRSCSSPASPHTIIGTSRAVNETSQSFHSPQYLEEASSRAFS